MARLPTYYLSHGGGPWPYMEGPFRRQFDQLEASLLAARAELGNAPHAVLVATGHWETRGFAVSTSPRPPMLYDYGGFPAETYRIRYDAPGSPDVAERVLSLLASGGIEASGDADRGFDHGTFSMMKPLFPDADVPIVQLSLAQVFDPELHLRAGRLLAPLRDEGVLIIGSGSSYHDLRRMDRSATEPSRRFDDWLGETLAADPHERWARLANWTSAPAARQAHPREDHLLPLMIAAGAAAHDEGARIYRQHDFMGSITLSSYRFGKVPSMEDATASLQHAAS
jgi:aromatic ring-opening dioxygenase catalytic subunit (LigB family)